MGPVIERIRLFLIESPIKMARLQGVGNVKGTVKRVLIEMTASDGIVGWGEAAPWEVFTGTAEGAFAEFVAGCYVGLVRTGYLLTGDRGYAEDP